MRILINIVLFFATASVIYIAIYLLRIDLKNRKINAQLEEEKDDCKKWICEIHKDIVKLADRVKALEDDKQPKKKGKNG